MMRTIIAKLLWKTLLYVSVEEKKEPVTITFVRGPDHVYYCD